jgi:hypothetical protein
MLLNFPGRKVDVEIPHVAFATGIGGWAVWYCWDAWHANAAVENLILILPVSLIAIVLYVFVIAGSIKRANIPPEGSSLHQPVSRKTGVRIAGSMALLGAFVLTGPLIGFDVASFLYMLLTMAFLGERRILVLVIVPLMFSVIVIYSFGTLLSTPLPVLILWGQS